MGSGRVPLVGDHCSGGLGVEVVGMKSFLVGAVVGVFVLLLVCIAAFEGQMIPAMWQLTSVIWMFVWWKWLT